MSIRIIKKYENRKLYDTETKDYTTLQKIKLLLDAGETVKIINEQTEEDITDVVMGRANAINSKAKNTNRKLIDASELNKLKKKVQSNIKLEQPFYFVDLFCGAGGLSCGLEMAGLECVFGTDFDKNAIETFNLNHKKASSFLGPIADLSEEMLLSKIGDKQIKLVAGGPPCQGFSTMGKGDPNDEKNALFNHYCRVLKILQPEYLLFENVTGLIAKKNQAVSSAILERFKELGYSVKIRVLESQHYGVPQKRKRTILLGTRLNRGIDFPQPQFGITKGEIYIPACTVGDALGNLKSSTGEAFNHDLDKTQIRANLTRERIKHIPEGRGIRYKKDEDEFLPDHLKLGIDWDTVKEGRLRELNLYRLNRQKPAPTINTQSHHYYHPTDDRRFSAREFASIQSFPSDFIFTGKNQSQIKQIGNAVPPLMAKALGEQIVKSYMSNDLNTDVKQPDISIENIRSEAFIYDNFAGLEKYQQKRKQDIFNQASSEKSSGDN